MAKLIELTMANDVGVTSPGPDGVQVYNYKKPVFKTIDGERMDLSQLELVCVEPIKILSAIPKKLIEDAVHNQAFDKAEKLALPYFMLSEYFKTNDEVIYLAQFYRLK